MFMTPARMPIFSCSTLTSGARQLVVQEALEITVCVDLQHVVVHAVHDGGIDVVAAGRRNHHFLRAGGQMRRRLGLAGEQAGALEHEIRAELAPGQFGGIALRDHADAVAVHHHRIAVDVHFAAEAAVRRVEAGQMGVGIGIAQIVDARRS